MKYAELPAKPNFWFTYDEFFWSGIFFNDYKN